MKKVIILVMTVSIWISGICNPMSSNAVYNRATQELLHNQSKYEPYRHIWNYFIHIIFYEKNLKITHTEGEI